MQSRNRPARDPPPKRVPHELTAWRLSVRAGLPERLSGSCRPHPQDQLRRFSSTIPLAHRTQPSTQARLPSTVSTTHTEQACPRRRPCASSMIFAGYRPPRRAMLATTFRPGAAHGQIVVRPPVAASASASATKAPRCRTASGSCRRRWRSAACCPAVAPRSGCDTSASFAQRRHRVWAYAAALIRLSHSMEKRRSTHAAAHVRRATRVRGRLPPAAHRADEPAPERCSARPLGPSTRVMVVGCQSPTVEHLERAGRRIARVHRERRCRMRLHTRTFMCNELPYSMLAVICEVSCEFHEVEVRADSLARMHRFADRAPHLSFHFRRRPCERAARVCVSRRPTIVSSLRALHAADKPNSRNVHAGTTEGANGGSASPARRTEHAQEAAPNRRSRIKWNAVIDTMSSCAATPRARPREGRPARRWIVHHEIAAGSAHDQ